MTLDPPVQANSLKNAPKECHCPFHCTLADCDEYGYCRHLIGFTNAGVTIEVIKKLMRNRSPELINGLDGLAKVAEHLAPYQAAIDRSSQGLGNRNANLIMAARLLWDVPAAAARVPQTPAVPHLSEEAERPPL